MDNSNIFNQYFYEVLDDMEDLARNSYIDSEDEDDKKVLEFCKKLKNALNGMDKNEVFNSSLIDFVEPLDPEEENILFYDLAVPFYENWSEMIKDAEKSQEERVRAFATCLAAEYIVRFLDDFLGYSYFFEDDEEDNE
ncbi:hypothetical protein [Treponema sp.]|uniref:hypothetical protein n=1 Tax=Treponema sp. TaxID=166 RepID=UPI00298DAA16|nr:hypothetical protein [Treponema sp.]